VGSTIIGTGIAIPDRVVTNDDLARIMDTSDEWITRRSGVRRRHFAPPGVGASDLAAQAGLAALDDAGLALEDIDLLVTATMTPDSLAPGIAALTQSKMGLGQIAAFDIRQQCSGFLYGMDLADAMLQSGRARTALVIGAETHGGFLPFGDTWEILFDRTREADSAVFARLSPYRGWAVLFGDGAGAMVLQTDEREDVGVQSAVLRSDGENFDLIQIPGVGFKNQPYIDATQLEAELHLPSMRGRELFRQAVQRMPESVIEAASSAKVELDDISLLITHQANARIVEGVRRGLQMAPEQVPINIDRYGNTTAATLPILFHEQRNAGAIKAGSVVGFTAYGAGAHWGALIYREPA
jgi:3-oxoacyl-[acyl-carrier-protein] synthase-3